MRLTSLRVLFAVLAATALTCAASGRGDAQPLRERLLGARRRIVGGRESLPKFKYPFLVELYDDSRHLCGGALVAPSIVYTAAHCTDLNTPPKPIFVAQHRHNLRLSPEEEHAQTRNVSKVITHPKYEFNLFHMDYDSALLYLDSPIFLPNEGDYARLDFQGDHLVPGTNVTLIGWGADSFDSPDWDSGVLKTLEGVWIDANTCKQLLRERADSPWDQLMPNWVTARAVCGEGHGETPNPDGIESMCNGDSGSPALARRKDGKMVVVGTAFFSYECGAKRTPFGYSSVHGVEPWLRSHLTLSSRGSYTR